MKRIRLAAIFGSFLFGAGMAGCGNPAGGTASAITSVAGNELSGEQLAMADGSGAGADDHAGKCGRNELDRLTALLGLSADQVTQIQKILDDTRQALKDLRAGVRAGTVTKADAEIKAKALHDQEKQQILALLSADQQAKFNAMRDHHGEPFDLARLAQALGLSADQQAKIKDLLTGTRIQIDAINAQAEAGTLSEADARTQIKQLLDAQLAAVKALLTADQIAKLPPDLGGAGGHGDGDRGGPGGDHGPGGGGGPGDNDGDGPGAGGGPGGRR